MSEHAFKGIIGLDRLSVYGLKFTSLNKSILDSEQNKGKVHHDGPKIIDDSSLKAQTVEHIKIIDNERFADLEIKTVWISSMCTKTYVNLNMTVHHILGDNQTNISVEDYRHEFRELRLYIMKTYGIGLDFRGAQVRSMEINCTLELSHPFNEYERALRVFFSGNPGKCKFGKLDNVSGTDGHAETFKKGNQQVELLIYDKSREMESNDKRNVPANLMRIEIRLLTPKKIEKVFNTNRFSCITNEMVANYFYGIICGFQSKYEKWQEKSKTELKKLVKRFREPYNQWHLKLLSFCLSLEIEQNEAVLLDIRDLKEVIEQDKNNHRARTIKSLDTHKANAEVFYRGDRDKIPEIMEQIEQAYLSSTPDRQMA